MKTTLERQAHELDEKMTLLETQKYPEILYNIMMNETLSILTEYQGRDFDKKMNRYLRLNNEPTLNTKNKN